MTIGRNNRILFLGLITVITTPAFCTDLIDVIPSLYGGDGVTLFRAGTFPHDAHFTADSLAKLSELANATSEISFPAPSSQGGFTYEFDPILNEFVQSANSLGPIFAERAETLGKGKLNIGMSYTSVKFTEYEGDDLGDIEVRFSHLDTNGDNDPNFPCIGGPPGDCYSFEKDKIVLNLDIEVESEVVALFATYGITNRLDVGILVPVVHNTLSVSASARIENDPSINNVPFIVHQFDPVDQDSPDDAVSDSNTGIGDILVRSKYHMWKSGSTQLAGTLELRLPTGDADNLRGIDRLGVRPSLVLSSSHKKGGGMFNPHINLGYEFNAGQAGQDEVDYLIGFDYGRKFRDDLITAAIDIIGSIETNHKDNIGDDVMDLAIGGKWSFKGKNLLYLNFQFPLNDDGLRADVIYTAGLETSF